MTTRTMELIDVIKNPQLLDCEKPEDAVIAYMSDTCMCPKEYYTTGIVTDILKDAFVDFISTCDNPWYYTKLLSDCLAYGPILSREMSLKDAIMRTLFSVRVMAHEEDALVYINGFDERVERLRKEWEKRQEEEEK